MVVINVLGTDLVIVTKPVFGKSGFFRKVPVTAKNPTLPQRKARAWLATTAHALQGTFGSTAKMPKIAEAIRAKAPGVGTHGGKTKREYVIAKRVGSARIAALVKEAAG